MVKEKKTKKQNQTDQFYPYHYRSDFMYVLADRGSREDHAFKLEAIPVYECGVGILELYVSLTYNKAPSTGLV